MGKWESPFSTRGKFDLKNKEDKNLNLLILKKKSIKRLVFTLVS